MEDKAAIKHLTAMLQKYSLTGAEQEAVREAIGILGWTKLLAGYQERRKQARDRRLQDLE